MKKTECTVETAMTVQTWTTTVNPNSLYINTYMTNAEDRVYCRDCNNYTDINGHSEPELSLYIYLWPIKKTECTVETATTVQTWTTTVNPNSLYINTYMTNEEDRVYCRDCNKCTDVNYHVELLLYMGGERERERERDRERERERERLQQLYRRQLPQWTLTICIQREREREGERGRERQREGETSATIQTSTTTVNSNYRAREREREKERERERKRERLQQLYRRQLPQWTLTLCIFIEKERERERLQQLYRHQLPQ